MKVEVSLFAFLAAYGPEGCRSFFVELEDGGEVRRLLDKLSLPVDLKLMLVVNGQAADAKQRLEDGDEVFIFTPVAGG